MNWPWDWVTLAGILLQAGGVLIALIGLGEAYRGFTNGRRLRRDMLVLQSKNQVVGVGAAMAGNATMKAFLVARPAPLGPYPSMQERVAYLETLTTNLSDELVATRKYATAEAQDAEKRAGDRTNEVADRTRVRRVAPDPMSPARCVSSRRSSDGNRHRSPSRILALSQLTSGPAGSRRIMLREL